MKNYCLDGNGHVYIVAEKYCSGDTDIIMGKYNTHDGSPVWIKQTEINGSNYLKSAIISGNYIYISGFNASNGHRSALTIKLDLNGNFTYKLFNSQGGSYGNYLFVDNSNNLYEAGRCDNPINYPKFLIIKYDSNFDTLWSYTYTGSLSGLFDEALSIKADQSGNSFVTGYTSQGQSNNDSYDYLTLKLDPNGNLLWAKRFNGAANKQDKAIFVNLDASANAYVTGFSYFITGSYIFTIKYNSNGDFSQFSFF